MSVKNSNQCSSCKHGTMDITLEPFCIHPNVTEYYRFGLIWDAAIRGFCGIDFHLREPRDESQPTNEENHV